MREVFEGDELVVREVQRWGEAPKLAFTPADLAKDDGRASRAEVERLHEALGRWLAR